VKIVLGIFIGFVFGIGTTLVSNHLVYVSYIPDDFKYRELLSLSSVEISNETFRCEKSMSSSVGGVLGEIFHSNSNSYLNRINESCSGGICQISHTNCKPWQTDSCGSTILSFKVNNSGEIEPLSFECLQVP